MQTRTIWDGKGKDSLPGARGEAGPNMFLLRSGAEHVSFVCFTRDEAGNKKHHMRMWAGVPLLGTAKLAFLKEYRPEEVAQEDVGHIYQHMFSNGFERRYCG